MCGLVVVVVGVGVGACVGEWVVVVVVVVVVKEDEVVVMVVVAFVSDSEWQWVSTTCCAHNVRAKRRLRVETSLGECYAPLKRLILAAMSHGFK